MNVIINSVGLLSAMGFLFASGLAIAGKKFAVEVDEKEAAILEALPGANCGGCGFPGCGGLASAIAKGEAPVNGCPVGGAAVADKISKIMGVQSDSSVRLVANVACNGTRENAREKARYSGILDCKAAMVAQSGSKGCEYGCLGLGSCVTACKFGAIYIGEDNIAHVNKDKCVSCGKCVEACPKNLISLIPENQNVYINCSSKDKLKAVKDECKVGCISCGMCVKNCPFGAIEMVDNLPVIDYSKCKQCNICVNKCPTKAIHGKLREKPAAKANVNNEAQGVKKPQEAQVKKEESKENVNEEKTKVDKE